MNQLNIQSLEEIKSLIEENNTALKAAIQALDVLTSQTLQQPAAQNPTPPPIPARNYPGYTTPPFFGFMQ